MTEQEALHMWLMENERRIYLEGGSFVEEAWYAALEWAGHGQEPVAIAEHTGLTQNNCQLVRILGEYYLPANTKLYTHPAPPPDVAELVEAAKAAIETVMEDAYHRRFAECCGRGQGNCCGDFVEQWSAEDHKIMDTLAPIQRRLNEKLAKWEGKQ